VCSLIISQSFHVLLPQRGCGLKFRKVSVSKQLKASEKDDYDELENNVINPSTGVQRPGYEKFLMMYTCKLCLGRNAHMVCFLSHFRDICFDDDFSRFRKLPTKKEWLSPHALPVNKSI
jgi:hypothetical protein